MNIKLIFDILYIKIGNDGLDNDDKKNIELKESIDDNDTQIIVRANIIKSKEDFDAFEKDKEKNNLFDIEDKQIKKNKKTEFTDFLYSTNNYLIKK